MVEFALDQVWLLTLFVLIERETASQIGIATPFKQEAATLVRAEDFCFLFLSPTPMAELKREKPTKEIVSNC